MATITGLQTINETALLEIDGDPRLLGGLDRDVGDLAIDTVNGGVYVKKTASPTGWQRIFQGAITNTQIPVGNATEEFTGSASLTWNGTNLNVGGTVNNVSVQAHAARHNPGGADALATAAPVVSRTDSANAEGNATSFARSNHIHKIELFESSVSAIGEVQTTSGTDVLLTDMTLTPPAGTYHVLAYSNSRNTSNGAINRFSIYSNGAQQANTLQNIQVSNNRDHAWMAEATVTVTGSQAIEIRWNRSAGTAQCFGRFLFLLRIA